MTRDSKPNTSDAILPVLLANHRRFLAFLQSRVGNSHDAEEILQSAFVRSLQKADEIHDSENAVAWFYRLLRNAVIDFYRRQASAHRSLEAFANQLSDPSEMPDPALNGIICECVKGLVPALKPAYAELITHVDLEGNDVTSVADTLGIAPGNARVRLHRARAALRREVERTCRTCAVHGCIDCSCGRKE
jgi:RNA polymerase sigma factor (sigma-70 family)